MCEPTVDEKAIADAVAKLMELIKPVLAGQPSFIQGATLGDALSLWLVGHPDHMREALLAVHLNYVRSLIPGAEFDLFGASGHPGNRLQRP